MVGSGFVVVGLRAPKRVISAEYWADYCVIKIISRNICPGIGLKEFSRCASVGTQLPPVRGRNVELLSL